MRNDLHKYQYILTRILLVAFLGSMISVPFAVLVVHVTSAPILPVALIAGVPVAACSIGAWKMMV